MQEMQSLNLFLILVLSNQCLSEKPLGPLVVTDSGQIRGHYLTSYKNNKYEAYQGIPYAQPPIGELRFQSPQPVEKWTHELPAIELKNSCWQDLPPQTNMPVACSEDCLHLNVYVPHRKTNASLPVIFYIHGGAFVGGGTAAGQEAYIIDHDVIFVSVNYRTGSFGFLSTEDDVIAGNMGLKDQALALRWTYDNIANFGGNRNKITLLGGSAGGTSVHLHYLSPWSRGLFHAGISHSGTAYLSVIGRRETAIALARVVNCTDDDARQMVKCLRDVPAEVLVEAQNKLQVWQGMPLIFGPVIEKSISDAFLDDHPSRILSDGRGYDVPWITGLVSEEGLVVTAGLVQGDTLKYVDDKWDSLAPLILNYLNTIPQEEHVSLARKIRSHYLGEKPINRENLRELTMLIGDRLFGIGGVNAAKAQASVNKSPVYFFCYGYRAVDSFGNVDSNSTENLGVAHGDDVHLVIKDPRILPTKSPNDMAMQKRLIKIWTSVAYNGMPDIGVEWPRVAPMDTGTAFTYLHLAGPDNLTAESNDNFAENKFWNSLGMDEK